MREKMPPPVMNGHPIKEQAETLRCIPFAPASSAESIDEQRIACLGRVIDAHTPHEALSVLNSHHAVPAQFPLPQRAGNTDRHVFGGWGWPFMQIARDLWIARQRNELGVIGLTERPQRQPRRSKSGD